MPSRARVVVIGGGVIGTSIAYHLGHLGWTDTVLVERDQLTSGTTWHAAGLMVTFGSTSETSTELRKYTRDLYARLEAETGLATGFKPVGFIELAADQDRLEEYRRVSAFNRYCGVDVEELSAREVAEMFPLARTDDILAGFYVAGDGRVNPVDVTMSMAKGARQTGVTIAQGVTVHDVVVRDGTACGVVTDHGTIECEYVVNAAGMWARQLGARSGVTIPLQAAEHYYLITETMEGLDPTWPVIEDPANYGYYREEVGGLMIGLFEPVCAPWKVDGIPADSSFTTLQPDWDRMAPYVEAAMSRVPISFDTGHPHVLLRSGELHARPAPDRRAGAGGAQLLRRRRTQLDRHPHRRRHRPPGRALDRRRRPGRRRHRHAPGAAPAVPGDARVPAHAHRRVARDGVPVPLPEPVDADRTRRQAVAAAHAARRRRARTSGTSAVGRAPTGTPAAAARPTRARSRGAARRSGRSGRPSTAPAARA